MGSLCCVAARPHGSNASSTEWSTGPHEPHWRTNMSFSPPPPRWDFRFQSERLPYDLHDHQLYDSSTSSDGRDSRTWMRGNNLSSNQYLASDGSGLFFSSPSDIFQVPQWTPPTIHGISSDDFATTRRDPDRGRISFTPTKEGSSAIHPDSDGSSSSRSNGNDYEPSIKSQLFSHYNFPNRHSFISKAIHPLSFPMFPAREASVTTPTNFNATQSQRGFHQRSSTSSSLDFTDVSESFDSDILPKSYTQTEWYKCGVCEILLCQRSPWSSRQIIRSGDMPVASVLSCRHVFHAECLEQATPITNRSDPSCPVCLKSEEAKSPTPQVTNRLKCRFTRPKPSREDGPSKPWSCVQAGDCVQGALQAPPRNTMLLLNRNRSKKNLSMKGNSSKDYPGKARKVGSYPTHLLSGRWVEQGDVGSSNSSASPSMK